VHVTISFDERLGLTEHERRAVRVRFQEPVADDLRNELHQVVRPPHRRTAAMVGCVRSSSASPSSSRPDEQRTGRMALG
jgi:hypothetical protein